ncbi:MAG: type IX secretion system outer membrane channel protein PorV [Ignavibacteria bacterium]|nr:type IX secretion system outer membrane channel protein PorV [Ignavibacteria bacterium]MCU7502219.1 type IX secretion system outer membrane channel protein PorV [Ignavibacteria bacterium]MCU7517436.1 type IX secretion system outer membrane channel protein PorV [Ignavibacteria bacterium]
MKVLSKLILLLAVVMGISRVSYAQGGETAVPFLLLAPDSRAGGIGESGAGLADNSAAIFWNPAGIAFQSGTELSITHSNWLPQFKLDLFYDYLTFRQYVPEIDGSITSSITYMNFGEFIQTGESDPTELGRFHSFDAALTVGYATKVTPDWGLGLNFRLIHSRLSGKISVGEQRGEGSATTVSFDIGGMWRPSKLEIPFTGEDIGNRFSIGANLSNIGPKIYYINKAQADPIPTNFRLGFAYKIMDDEYNSLTYTLDFSKLLVSRKEPKDEFYKAIFTAWNDQSFKDELREIVTSMGLEYVYGIPGDYQFAVRGGYFYEDPSYGNRKFLTLGAGIRYDMYGFDFSYITTSVFKGGENHPLSDTLRFTLLIGWGSAPAQTKGLPRGI